MNERSIFMEALDLSDPCEQEAHVLRACQGDERLRARVEALLRSHREADGFVLDRKPDVDASATVDTAPSLEGPGTVIGPYKLLEQVGEGGMGAVYVAEQTHPVRRRVALKVIKPGMDTKQVLARFEAERQALAMMDHPNIARVLDAGATETGRPYFVMELVKGIPITEYCDHERLSIPARLELFVLVCRAVQHAHQKGIIHRDIKPSNVLITLHDGVPVPKVIDFGIAKATTGQSLTDKTLYTGFAQLVGTPLYMSPEQAELSGLDIDTRSDVYSLGVLLYELLTGTTPFDSETLRKAAFDEMRRIIREEEPQKPSTRLSSLGGTLSTVSAKRGGDSRRLNRAVRGELDWVVMRALEKDRRRRYETANDFATDVMRYLTDRPVEAFPPSARYRFMKYARRNRAAIATAGLVTAVLLTGAAVSTWQAVRATRAEADAERRARESRQVVDYLAQDLLVAASPQKSRGRTLTVPDLLQIADSTLSDRFRDQPLVEASVRLALARVYLGAFWRHDDAAKQAARAASLREQFLGPNHLDTLDARCEQAWALAASSYSDPARAESAAHLARGVLSGRRSLLGPTHSDTLWAQSVLSQAVAYAGRPVEAELLQTEAAALALANLGPDHRITLAAHDILGRVVLRRGDFARAEAVFRQSLAEHERAVGAFDFQTWHALYGLADVVREHGNSDEWLALSLALVDRGCRVFGPCQVEIELPLGWVNEILHRRGDFAGLRDFHERLRREILADPVVSGQGHASRRSRRLARSAGALAALPDTVPFDAELAVRAAEEAVALDASWDHPATHLAVVYYRLGRLDDAARTIQAATARPKWKGGDDFDWLVLALIHARRGEPAQARAWYDKARSRPDPVVFNRDDFLSLREEADSLLASQSVHRGSKPKIPPRSTRPRD